MAIYLFPLVLDLVLFLVIGRVADTSGREMHLSDFHTALLIGMQSITYIPACFAAGCFLNRANARRILIISTALVLLVNIPLLFTRSYWVALPLMGLLGVFSAVFFNSAQTFMRGDVPPGTLSRTISLYNIAWSSGIACGFLFGGILNFVGGSAALAAFSTALCGWILYLIFTHKSRPLHHDSADGEIETALPGARPVDGRYVFVGWILAMLMNFTQRPIMTFIPKFYAENHEKKWVAGTVLFTMIIMQAAMSRVGPSLRRWFYSRSSLIGMHLALAVCLGLCWLTAASVTWSILPMAALGCVFGMLIYASIYYVSNDSRASFNVGINEAMVGVGNAGGALGCGAIMMWLGDRYKYAYFPTSIALTLLMLAWLLMRLRRPIAPAQKEPVARSLAARE